MGSGLLLFRPGTFYRVQAQIEIVEPLPKGVSALVVLDPEIADVMMITSGAMREGFSGPVYFTISPFRKVEVEKLTSLGCLMFFEDGAEAVLPEALIRRMDAMETVLKHVVEGKLPLQTGDPENSKSNRTENDQGPVNASSHSTAKRTRVSRGDGDAAGNPSEQSGPSAN